MNAPRPQFLPPEARFLLSGKPALRIAPRQSLRSAPGRKSRRGTVLLLVMMLLVFLTLFATTLSYVSRLDAQATHNASLSVQTIMAAVTGVNEAISIFSTTFGQVPPNISFSTSSTFAISLDPRSMALSIRSYSLEDTPESEKLNADNIVLGNQPGASIEREDPIQVGPLLAGADGKIVLHQSSTPTPTPTPVPVLYSPPPLKNPATRLAIYTYTDPCGLINLNAFQSYETTDPLPGDPLPSPPARRGLPTTMLETLIARFGYDATNAQIMSRAILAARLGPDGRPGLAGVDDDGLMRALIEQINPTRPAPQNPGAPSQTPTEPNPADIDDANEYQPDLLQPPHGDDTPYHHVENLKRIPGMTPSLYYNLAPYLTTLSSNLELWRDAYNAIHALAPLNSSTTAQYLAVLQSLRPKAEETLLQQFAANLTDRRDADSIPTLFENVAGAYPVLGFEITIVISEICPDVITPTEDGDNGEYFEIYNPLSYKVDLTGWRLDWGTGSHILTGSIDSHAFLILTDDIMNDNDPKGEEDAPGMGSFYDIFRDIPSKSNRIVEIADMDLPDAQGIVRLMDNEGNLISYLAYRSANYNGLSRGFHKPDPFSNMALPDTATPFAHQIRTPDEGYNKTCWDVLKTRMNKPFLNRAEILAIPTIYPIPGAIETEPRALFPLLAIRDDSTLDLRLLDCFTAAWSTSAFAADGTLASIAPEAFTGFTTTTLPISHGKINLQTAPVEVIATLPGMDLALAAQIIQTRDWVNANPGAGLTSDTLAFQSLSYFANSPSVWANRTHTERLVALHNLAPIITFNSISYVITSSNRPEALPGQSRKKSMTCRATVNLRPGGADILQWSYLPLKR